MRLRDAGPPDLDTVLAIHRRAFGTDEEADLVAAILADRTARPTVSLLAESGDGEALGHILFSRADLAGPAEPISGALLAPLAVIPEAQGQGVGGKLIEAGVERLSQAGADLVFVLGYPDYYTRHGFQPAGVRGIEAPYPIAPENAAAWMVRALRPGVLGAITGRVAVCHAIDAPEYWQE